MANDIKLVTKYLPLLDEVYKQSAKTAILDAFLLYLKISFSMLSL